MASRYSGPVSLSGKSSGPRPPAARAGGRAADRIAGGGPNAREIVVRRLTEQARLFPDLALAPLDVEGLDDRDAALAHAIFDAVIRRWITLEFLLDTALKTPVHGIEPALQAVLLSGAAQIFFLDRVPVHAAINESVELAKRLIRPGAGPITNAVLRKMAGLRPEAAPTADSARLVPSNPAEVARDQLPLSDGRVLSLTAPVLPEDRLVRLAVATSHPTWLIGRWEAQFGATDATALAYHSLCAPPTILNTAHALRPLPAVLAPHSRAGHHVFAGYRADLVRLLDERPDIWVQDPASSRAIASAAHLEPRVIIDACAGQGTKTRQLAATFPHARIIASDTDAARFRTLESGFRDHPQVRVVPAQELLERCHGTADLLLLDVPCSNTGVLARRAEARYRCSDTQLERLSGIQRQIIADTLPLLRAGPRGRLLYSTCSLDHEENRGIVEWACRWHSFRIEHQASVQPTGLPGGLPADYQDGSYSALLA